MKLGLIGKVLGHSLSKALFEQKFRQRQEWKGYCYELLELADLDDVRRQVSQRGWRGFNVTIPYKEAIMEYLDHVDPHARAIGAVNTVVVDEDGQWHGYNTDWLGFLHTLCDWHGKRALILGSGGAAKAVRYALRRKGVEYKIVSRALNRGDLTYAALREHHIQEVDLIVQCTPVGMYPHDDELPALPYAALSHRQYLYDLIYRPALTGFLREGLRRGCAVRNGYGMLVLQAEASWAIWQEKFV